MSLYELRLDWPVTCSDEDVDRSGGDARHFFAVLAPFVENTPWRNTQQRRALESMEIREVLALNLRRYRHAAKLSQEELAHRAQIDRTYVSSLERSVYAAGIDVVDRLARALGVEAADLVRRPSSSSNRRRMGKSRRLPR